MEKVLEININDQPGFLDRLIDFANGFSHASVLISNQYPDVYGKYELLAGIGKHQSGLNEIRSTKQLKQQISNKKWLFGHLTYDLKNELEKLSSSKGANFKFEQINFFEPQIVVKQPRGGENVTIYLQEEIDKAVLGDLLNIKAVECKPQKMPPFQPRITKENYLEALQQVKDEIQFGNVYEINYCQEFYADHVDLNPKDVFIRLNRKSPMPFAAFYKNNSEYLLCASPERYLKKEQEQLITQPIKGTGRRGKTEEEDHALQVKLRGDLKEQTENVMIVDLVRNDLSRTAQKGSVHVKELFGVYQFPQVNQLISTVESKLDNKYDLVDAITNSFPMGSMTGAPKISAMKIADRLEGSRRELYSGSVGYIDPEGDFDLNVVIRSLLYSTESKYLSLTVGGAITALSDAEKEYEECLLKAKAIFEL